MSGSQLFLNPGGNLHGSINQLIAAVQTNSGIAAASDALGQAASQFEAQRSFYGTSLNQLQSTSTFLSSQNLQLSSQENNLDASDVAKVTTSFSQAEVAYTALLEAEGKVLSLPPDQLPAVALLKRHRETEKPKKKSQNTCD